MFLYHLNDGNTKIQLYLWYFKYFFHIFLCSTVFGPIPIVYILYHQSKVSTTCATIMWITTCVNFSIELKIWHNPYHPIMKYLIKKHSLAQQNAHKADVK